MKNQTTEKIWGTIILLEQQLRDARPEERSELSRRYAVVITDIEKSKCFFNDMIRNADND